MMWKYYGANITRKLPLDPNAKTRLKDIYNRNSQLFDGKAKLPDKDFAPISTKQTTLLAAKSGQVTDLKSAEPATPKLNAPSEFSLTSKSPSLPASTKTAQGLATSPLKIVFMKASAAGIDPIVDCEGTILAWAQENPAYAATCKCSNGPHALPVCGGGGGTGTGWLDKFKAALKNAAKAISDLYHKLKGDKECGDIWYDPDNACCVNGAILAKCGNVCYNPTTECCKDNTVIKKKNCGAGSTVVIKAESSDLILHKPPENSKPLSLQATISCPCPEKIQWTSSSDKIRFVGATNQPSVQIMPVSESVNKGDISVTVTVDGITSEPKKLTVRRPKFMSHPSLVFKLTDYKYIVWAGAAGGFHWTLKDQLKEIMPGIHVTEEVRKDPSCSRAVSWPEGYVIREGNISTATGEVPDMYRLTATFVFESREGFNCLLHQTLRANGYAETTDIKITLTNISTENLVTLK